MKNRISALMLSLALIFLLSFQCFAINESVFDNSYEWYDVEKQLIYAQDGEIIGSFKAIKDVDSCCYYGQIETNAINLTNENNEIFIDGLINCNKNVFNIKIGNDLQDNDNFKLHSKTAVNVKYNIIKTTFALEFEPKKFSDNIIISLNLFVNDEMFTVIKNDSFDLSIYKPTTKPTTEKTTKENTTKVTTNKEKISTTKRISVSKSENVKSTNTTDKPTTTELTSETSSTRNAQINSTAPSNATSVAKIMAISLIVIGIIATAFGLLRKNLIYKNK